MEKPSNKKPKISKPSSLELPEFVKDRFGISPELKKELDDQGLVARWVSINRIQSYGGFHDKGWRPYKRKIDKTGAEFLFGKDPDGYTRHGDLVLAVKSIEEVEKHRAYLRYEAEQQSVKNMLKSKKNKMKDYLRSNKMSDVMTVVED